MRIAHIALALVVTAQGVCAGTAIQWSGPQAIDLFYLADHDLDVDGNGTADFHYGGITTQLTIEPVNSDQNWMAVERFPDGLGNLAVLPLGTEIGPDIATSPDYGWHDEDSPYSLMGAYTLGTAGPWVGVEDGLLGFQFEAEDGVHYGWAQMSYVNDYHITLDGWAWETQPGVSILAGAVPEPTTWALMVTGLAVLLGRGKRR